MKVVAFNGSHRKDGNTFHLSQLVCSALNKEGTETQPSNTSS
jgi:multimeric flavodoxin WrbA